MRPFLGLMGCGYLATVLTGCAYPGGLNNADRNQFVTEFDAVVHDVRQVSFQSNMGSALAVGAVGGAVTNSRGDTGDIIGGALIGSMVTGLFTAMLEGDNRGYEYDLEAIDGDIVTVVVDYEPAEVGDCVRVRVSGTVNIYLQAPHFCEPDSHAEE